MAQPLTSSDIIRERMGFGVSNLASPDTRRAYFEAGLSPLGTQERERLARGAGISMMAGPEEKKAWIAAEVQAGKRPQSDLPEEYGGRPQTGVPTFDRRGEPTGTYRRKLRMQEAWDIEQKNALENQRFQQQMEINQKQLEMQLRDQQIQENTFYYDRGLKEAEQQMKAEQVSQAANIVNSLTSVDPRTPDFRLTTSNILNSNPLGAADQGVQKILSERIAVNDTYMKSLSDAASGIKQAQDQYAQDMQKLMEAGVTEEELPQYINPKSPVGLPMFDPLKVAAKLGTTKAEEKKQAAAIKEETPKDKVNLDLQQAYGELNQTLMSGGDIEAPSSKVAGLRERYKAITGEDAPEVYPKPKNDKEKERLPSGTFYYDPQGTLRKKP